MEGMIFYTTKKIYITKFIKYCVNLDNMGRWSYEANYNDIIFIPCERFRLEKLKSVTDWVEIVVSENKYF